MISILTTRNTIFLCPSSQPIAVHFWLLSNSATTLGPPSVFSQPYLLLPTLPSVTARLRHVQLLMKLIEILAESVKLKYNAPSWIDLLLKEIMTNSSSLLMLNIMQSLFQGKNDVAFTVVNWHTITQFYLPCKGHHSTFLQ